MDLGFAEGAAGAEDLALAIGGRERQLSSWASRRAAQWLTRGEETEVPQSSSRPAATLRMETPWTYICQRPAALPFG